MTVNSAQKISCVDVADQRVDPEICINSVPHITELLSLIPCREEAVHDVAPLARRD